MKGLILAGGKGTRLRPLTVFTPKPVVPVVNKPFLLYQIEIFRRAGISDVTLSLSYQPDKIISALDAFDHADSNIHYITEPQQMGTGGAYKYAAAGETEPVVVFNGDVLTDVDLSQIIELHRKKGAQATIVLVPVEDPSRYGLVETDDESRVLRFLEKPKKEELANLTTNNINAGIYILEPGVLDLIPDGENYSFEYNVFPSILEKELPFYAYVMRENYWRDIGTPESYREAHVDLLNGTVKGFNVERVAGSEVATAATVDRVSVLGEGCVIKPNAKILNSVLGPGVHVEEKAVIENSVIWSHTRISSFAEVRNAVLGRSCHIGRNVVISEDSVLGDKTSLSDYSKV